MVDEILKEFKEKFANSKYFQDRYCLDWLKEKLTSFEKKVKEEAQEVIGVIKWREIGKKYKYWDYFEKEVKGEERNRIDREISKLLQEDANTKLNERLSGWDTLLKLRKTLIKKE